MGDALCKQKKGQVKYFPIRHHSPICSIHLKRMIEAYEPDCILIEGSSDDNHLIQDIGSEENRAPFCLYHSFDDVKGQAGEENRKYRGYFPLLDYSPELVAVREGRKKKVKTAFIDLPYACRIIYESRISDEDIQTDNIRLKHIEDRLIKQYKCRNYEEFWEQVFEIGCVGDDTEEFIQKMYYIGRVFREGRSKLGIDCIREQHMASQITFYQMKYEKILIVVGSFHVEGIKSFKEEDLKLSLPIVDKRNAPTYMMSYSYKESNKESGYSAGMVYPYFYQQAWRMLCKEENYERVVLDFIVKTGRWIRKKDCLSVDDEMQALYMARGLAQIRNKAYPGAYELLDAVQSVFVKGELNRVSVPRLLYLKELMVGKDVGKINISSNVPPVIQDFREKCQYFRIRINQTKKQTITLDIIKKKRHDEKSRFLKRLRYLNNPFGVCIKGPNFIEEKDLHLVRETWSCCFTANVESHLINESIFGATIEEICRYKLKEELSTENLSASQMCHGLIKAFEIGLLDVLLIGLDQIEDCILKDNDFYSITETLHKLAYLQSFTALSEIQANYNMLNKIEGLLDYTLKRATIWLGINSNVGEQEGAVVSKGIKWMYDYVSQRNLITEAEPFYAILYERLEEQNYPSQVLGTMLGVLYKCEKVTMNEFSKYMSKTIESLPTDSNHLSNFILGLFEVARDLIFLDETILESIHAMICDCDMETFLERVPGFRLAFTVFTPEEVQRIAKEVAKRFGENPQAILAPTLEVSQEAFEKGLYLNDYCEKQLTKWGYGNEP